MIMALSHTKVYMTYNVHSSVSFALSCFALGCYSYSCCTFLSLNVQKMTLILFPFLAYKDASNRSKRNNLERRQVVSLGMLGRHK